MEETTWKSFRIWGFADPYKYTAQLITPTSIRCSSLSLARSASSDGQFLSFFSAAPHHRLIGCRTGLGSYGAAQTNGRYVHVDRVVVLFGMTALVLAIEVDRILN